MKTQIITSVYQSAHGKAPRGLGTWAFTQTRRGEVVMWFFGTYGKAKKFAENSEYPTLYVGS